MRRRHTQHDGVALGRDAVPLQSDWLSTECQAGQARRHDQRDQSHADGAENLQARGISVGIEACVAGQAFAAAATAATSMIAAAAKNSRGV